MEFLRLREDIEVKENGVFRKTSEQNITKIVDH
jgi:hypothetical protein